MEPGGKPRRSRARRRERARCSCWTLAGRPRRAQGLLASRPPPPRRAAGAAATRRQGNGATRARRQGNERGEGRRGRRGCPAAAGALEQGPAAGKEGGGAFRPLPAPSSPRALPPAAAAPQAPPCRRRPAPAPWIRGAEASREEGGGGPPARIWWRRRVDLEETRADARMRENALICAARGPSRIFPHRMRNLLEYLQCRLVADFTHPQRVEGAAGVSLGGKLQFLKKKFGANFQSSFSISQKSISS